MTNNIQQTGFKPREIELGKSYQTIVEPNVVQTKSEQGGLDSLYFVTNNSLRDKVISILTKGAEAGNFDLVELNDVASRRKTRISEYDDDEKAYEVMVNNVDRLTGELRGLEECRIDEISSNYPIAKPRDVLYLRLRPYRRKVTVVPEKTKIGMNLVDLNEEVLACSGEMCVLKPPQQTELSSNFAKEWDPEYLQLILQSNIVLFQLLPATKGGTRPRVPFDEIMSVMLPYPDKETRDQMVKDMKEFQEDLRKIKEKHNDLMGPSIFEGIGISTFEAGENSPIMDGLDDDFASLLAEADLLPENFSNDPFDQMS